MRRTLFAGISLSASAVASCVPWSSLYGSACGNGRVEGHEECDDGNADDGDACLSSCRWASCGDGVVRRSVEECDGEDAGCSPACLACSGDGTYLRDDNGHCYTYHVDTRSISVAGATCAAESASVVTFPDYHDPDRLFDGLLSSRPVPIWLGMRRGRSGTFVWNTTGEPPVRFGPMLASSMSPDDCAIQTIAAGATDASVAVWTAVSCSGTIFNYVCERSPITIRPADHHAYRVFYDPIAWTDAATACTAVHGHLATLNDAGENDFVALLNQVDLWVGGLDVAADGRFGWVTGEPFTYTNFSPQSGDKDATTDCLMLGALDHRWYARHCKDKTAFVCEFD
jgi:cysteine-rich repeat protein